MSTRTSRSSSLGFWVMALAVALVFSQHAWATPASALTVGPSGAGTAVGWTTTPAAAAGTPDGSCASTTAGNSFLTLSGFGLTVPADAELRGLEVEATVAGPTNRDLRVFFKRPDGRQSRAKLARPTGTTCGAASDIPLGGPADLWGLSGLTPADVNSGAFSVLINSGSGNVATRFVDGVTVTAHYAPKGPIGLTATAASSSQINLSWTDVSTLENDFHIERCVGNACGTFTELATVAANTTTYSDTGLSDNTAYRYRVRGHEHTGGLFSPYSSIVAGTTPPIAPTLLVATTSGSTQIDLSWTDNSTGELAFLLERCIGVACTDFRPAGSTIRDITTYTDTGLSLDRVYRYRVRAQGKVAGVYSSYAAIASARSGPRAPTRLDAATGGSTQINLTWADNSVLESDYHVERCAGAACTDFAEVGTAAADSIAYSDSGLDPDTIFLYRVRAHDHSTGLYSGYSNLEMFNTAPDAPSDVTATAIGAVQVDLAWTDNSGIESHFHIERCLGVGCLDFEEVAGATSNAGTFSNRGLKENTTYRYRLRSHRHGSDLYSGYSAVATVTTPPKPPTNLTAAATSSSLATLHWNDISTAESDYHIERCAGVDCAGFAEVATVAAGVTTYANTGLTENTAYSYRVRAHQHSSDLYSTYVATASATLPLSTPTTVTATSAADTQINLAWTDTSAVENDVHIERCAGVTCTGFVEITTVASGTTTYSDMGLTVDTIYRYRIRAHEHAGDNYSFYSALVSASTVPDAPSALAASSSGSTTASITWTDNSGVETEFHIERCAGAACAGFAEIATVAANVQNYVNSGLAENTLYRFQVRAHAHTGGGIHSAYSAIAEVRTLLSTPTTLAAVAVSGTQADLTWTDNSSAESDYHVERCTGATCTAFVEIATPVANSTAYSNTGLTENTSYRYRVRAHEHVNDNDSAYSSVVTITTLPNAPSALAASAGSSSQISLSWTDNSAGESDVHIERCQGAACSNFVELATVTANVTVYSDTGLTEGTTYLYRVRAHSHSSLLYSVYAATATGVTLPSTPSGLAAATVSATQVDLTWTDNSAGESDFHVERCTGAGCAVFAEIDTVAANGTTYSNTGLTEGTVYGYRVRAHDHVASQYSSFSATATATAAPNAPSALAATAISATRIDLSWADNSAIEEDVHIERCPGAACSNFVEITSVAAGTTTYADTSLSADTTYRYQIRAHDHGASQYSLYSGIDSATTAPNAPTGLTAAAVSGTQLNLTWVDNSAVETGFSVERCSGVGCMDFAEITTPAADATSYSDMTASADTLYRYRILAQDSGSGLSSSYSAIASATTTPNAPSALSAAATGETQVILSWTDNSLVESEFHIERCSGAGCAVFTDITQVTANTSGYTNNGLTADTSYTYRVRAHEHSGGLYSAYSASFTVVTQPAAPSALMVTPISDTQIDLAWTDNSAVETDFHIERCTGAACTDFAEIATVAADTTTYSNTGLTASTLYRYRVRAHEHISGLYSSYSSIAEDSTTA